MPRPRKTTQTKPAPRILDAQAFFDSAGVAKKIAEYEPLAVIFAQGDPGDNVMYIQKGAVRLSVLSHAGKEAIVGMLGPGDFIGEGARKLSADRRTGSTGVRAPRAPHREPAVDRGRPPARCASLPDCCDRRRPDRARRDSPRPPRSTPMRRFAPLRPNQLGLLEPRLAILLGWL